MRRIDLHLVCVAAWVIGAAAFGADVPGPAKPPPGSMIEDRAAGKLLEAGQARYEADEPAKAVEIWQSVIERYPRSRVRFAAHLLLGKHFLERERAYERARVHFAVAAGEDNPDQEQRAEAMMRAGACYYHLRNHGKSFQVLRDLIDKFPASPFVNDAYYYIGLGHFQLGHYGRAIAALENVGTAMTAEKGKVEKVEAGKRLFVRIEDADLAILDPQQPIEVQCEATSGDREEVKCFPIARNTRLAIGSIPTQLGKPVPGNGQLEIKGDDKVKIVYVDQHTAEKEMNRKVLRSVEVVGTALVRITDGAFSESLMGVVLGKELNLQVSDGDRDLTDQADTVKGTREVSAQARCLEGNIGAVRVSHALISDQELRIQTQLKTASALTNIGNRYKEFGLKKNADEKYKQALAVCEEIMSEAAKLGGRVLEETYVQLWRVYFEMERLDLAAAMCQRLQQQFPSSGFVDEALLQLAEVARKQNDLPRAIRTYSSLLAIRTSPLRGEGQFGIAQCYDQMAQAAAESTAAPANVVAANVAALRARAFQEYKKVFDQFSDSGRVGDAVAKMADYYYDQKDYARATEVFENVIANYPDAKFLDVIYFNYGRCLYRMDRKPQALVKFEQLLTEFPDSPLATDAKKIADAMRQAGK